MDAVPAQPVGHVVAGPVPALVAARVWLAILVLAGLAQGYFMLQLKNVVPTDFPLWVTLYRIRLISVVLGTFVAGVGLYLICTGRSRAALAGAFAALFFVHPLNWLLTNIVIRLVGGEEFAPRLFRLGGLPELGISVLVTMALLLSPRANAMFGIDTSSRFFAAAPRFWTRLRGRQHFEDDIQDLETR